MELQLAEIAALLQAEYNGDEGVVNSISIDTRTLKAGALYIAIKGERFDGHDFVKQAEQAGASALLVEKKLVSELPQLLVEDTRLALAEIAGVWRDSMPVKVVGVTGSNGKTTVKELMATILSVADGTLFTQGNLNNDIGVPLTLLRLQLEHRYAVIEMGANHLGEIAYTSAYAKPDVAVINNVGAAHIEGFGDLQGVARTKGEMIANVPEDGAVVLNRDDAFFEYWLGLAGQRKVVSFGLHEQADVRAQQIDMKIEDGVFVTQFELCLDGQSHPMRLHLAGEHNVKNALAATAACLQLGIEIAQIRRGLSLMKPVAGRLQPLIGQQGEIIINDSYNANPSSMQAALQVLMQCPGEPWVAMGAFGELGVDSVAMHREMGELMKQMGVQRLWAVGEDAAETVVGFADGGRFFQSHEDLIAAMQAELTGQQTILIKGSRAQQMEKVSAALAAKS